MFRKKLAIRTVALVSALLCLASAGTASGPAKPSPSVEYLYHSLIPLGSEAFLVAPWKSVLTIVASAENPEFEGWRRETLEQRSRLVDALGNPVRYFPDEISFRVTLTTRKRSPDGEPFPIKASVPQNDYLLNVQFRLKIFHGLRQTVLPASSVEMIGVPADLPYDERIYRLNFDLDDVPTDDRVVLEVLAPSGERLCKFHLDLH